MRSYVLRAGRTTPAQARALATLAPRWLLRYIAMHDFVPFAWYRLAFGVLVLLTAWTGWVHWAD